MDVKKELWDGGRFPVPLSCNPLTLFYPFTPISLNILILYAIFNLCKYVVSPGPGCVRKVFPLLIDPILVLVLAAVIPAALLLISVYRRDRIEKEPPRLLLSLVLYGILATMIAMVLERLGSALLDSLLPPESLLSDILLYFGIVAFAEEGGKYFLLKKRTWGIPDFNCLFDGVVYAVFVSLGFALWENIGYVFMYGLSTALVRAVTAIPGHACFGVFMGCFYARAYARHLQGDEAGSRASRALSLLVPALLHGLYDFLAAGSKWYGGWPFLIFVAILFFYTRQKIRKLSGEDDFLA